MNEWTGMRSVPEAQLVRLLGDWQGAQAGGSGRAVAPGYARLAAALRALLLDARVPAGARLPHPLKTESDKSLA